MIFSAPRRLDFRRMMMRHGYEFSEFCALTTYESEGDDDASHLCNLRYTAKAR